MKGYIIISLEKLEHLKIGMSGGADPIPQSTREAIPFGAIKAIRQIEELAEREISQDEYDLINDILNRIEGEKGNGGFVKEGE